MFRYPSTDNSVTTLGDALGSVPCMSGIGERVREAMLDLGLTQRELGERVGMSQQGIDSILSGKSKHPRKIVELARVLRRTPEYLLHGDAQEPQRVPLGQEFEPDGDGDMPPAIGNGKRRHLSPGAVPEFDLRGGASYGGGYALPSIVRDGDRVYDADIVKAEWIIPPSFLQGELRLTPAYTDVIAVDGPSMIPDLMPGDRVLIDRTHRDPRQGGIFAVREDDGIIIKHVEIVRGSDPIRIVCKSSNPTYTPFELVLDGDRVAIIGRVAGRISRL